MDYLRSAASAVLSKSAGPLPGFTIGSPVAHPGIWTLHNGTKREDSSNCSILVYETNSSSSGNFNSSTHLALARNALRKLRTLRHPDVLKLIDSNETPNGIYIAIEPVRCLDQFLDQEWTGSAESKKEWIVWGLSKVANALKFIHSNTSSIHGNIRPDSIFLSQGGEWRLGGFELLTAKDDHQGVLWSLAGSLPDASTYASPEVKQNGWTILKDYDTHVLDSYSFTLLAFSAFNDSLSTTHQGSIPGPLFTLLRRMSTPTPKTRMSVASLYDTASGTGGMFSTNRLNVLAQGCENLMLASDSERNEVMKMLEKSSASLPSDFLTHRVLPSLVNALTLSAQQSGNGANTGHQLSRAVSPSSLLPLVLQLGAPLSDPEWTQSVWPPIQRAYTLQDRAVRIVLLEQIDKYIERLDTRKVSDSIWPQFITGFADSSAAIRESTLKSILPLCPKLSDRIKNNDLLRQLAKSQVDVEPSIRTNTTILLGRLSEQLNKNTRKSVLIPAFSRSLKDPFVHARVAGLMALMATSESTYDRDDLAKSILPLVVVLLVDQEKLVRDQAMKAVDLFLGRVKEEIQNMPESVLPPEGSENGINTSTPSVASTPGGAASALAGWAVGSAMNYLSSQSGVDGVHSEAVTSPGPMDNKRPPLLTGVSTSSMTASATASASTSTTPSPSLSRTASQSEWNTKSAIPSSDLIDMEDDTADWSNFESAPVKKPIVVRGTKARRGSSNNPQSLSSSTMSRLSNSTSLSESNNDAWDTTTTTTTTAPAAAAFKTPVPSWSDFPPDDDDNDSTTAKATKATTGGEPLSKEDKRKEMERQREERRERMRKLKESKGKKLGDSLM